MKAGVGGAKGKQIEGNEICWVWVGPSLRSLPLSLIENQWGRNGLRQLWAQPPTKQTQLSYLI